MLDLVAEPLFDMDPALAARLAPTCKSWSATTSTWRGQQTFLSLAALIDIDQAWITDEDTKHIARSVPSLRCIEIVDDAVEAYHLRITAATLVTFAASCARLTSFVYEARPSSTPTIEAWSEGADTSICKHKVVEPVLTEDAMHALASKGCLQELVIVGCAGLTDATVAAFGMLSLRHLSMERCWPTDCALAAALSSCPNLEFLCVHECGTMVRSLAALVAFCPKLREVDLRVRELEDESARATPISTGCPELRVVSLGAWNSISGVYNLPHLHTLSLTFCSSLNDTQLGPLRYTRTLRRLSLLGCERVTDAGVGELATLRLQGLAVTHNPNVSDTGLEHLRRCVALERLDVSCCPRTTARGCCTLIDALPRLLLCCGCQVDPDCDEACPSCGGDGSWHVTESGSTPPLLAQLRRRCVRAVDCEGFEIVAQSIGFGEAPSSILGYQGPGAMRAWGDLQVK